MKSHNLIAIAFLFIFPFLSFSQKDRPDFGSYSPEELSLKECPFDKGADAVILLDEASSSHDDDYQLITTRRIRIKILNDRAIDRANIYIRFYSKDEFETVSDIRAISYTIAGNGEPVVSSVDKRSIFKEQEDDRISVVKFAIPNVKAGSIIEYKYRSVMKNYGGLRDWEFQSDLPTYRSCYNLEVLPTSEFAYQVQKDRNYPIIVEPKTDRGQIYFEMDNIPGLRFEPYMDAVKDYLQKVEFQLSAYVNYFGSTNKVNQTWRDLAYDLYTEKAFCGAFRKDYPGMDDLKLQVAQKNTATEKIKIIYDYVKHHFTWNGYDGKYAVDGLKKVWEKATGTAGEINLLLVNLLQLFDLECYPLLVAERDFGKIDTKYPYIDRFNKVVAYVNADNNVFILDATQTYTPIGLTPYPLLNTNAFLVDRKKFGVFTIESIGEKFEDLIIIHSKLSDKGVFSGHAQITSRQYASQLHIEKITKDTRGYIKELSADGPEGLTIDSFYSVPPDSLHGSLIQDVYFHNDLNEDGSFVLLNCNLFMGLSKNPFTSDIRFTNVNFGYPYSIELKGEIELPSNCTIDELPKPKRITTPDKEINVYREVKQEGNLLKVSLSFEQTATLFPSDAYRPLKQVYKLLVDMLNEPVAIKLVKK